MDIKQTETRINYELAKIQHPEYKRNLPDLGMTARLEQNGDGYKLYVKTPDDNRKVQITLEAQIRGIVREFIPENLKIKFELDESLKKDLVSNRVPGIKNIIAVGSGKGGVGKSTVSSNLAAAMVNRGYKVGLMDGDIYGPSIGKMFGHEGKVKLRSDGESKIFPENTAPGLKIFSFSFLLDQGQAVIWRGPMLGKAVEQFLFEVRWGELDFLIIDLPPGTGDVQLSLVQLIELDGAVIVTTPQNVALEDASRALAMFEHTKVPVLGVVENMSEFICPSCGTVSHIFSEKGAENFSYQYNVPKLGGIPLQKDIMDAGESGRPYLLEHKEGPIADAYNEIIDKLVVEVEKYKTADTPA